MRRGPGRGTPRRGSRIASPHPAALLVAPSVGAPDAGDQHLELLDGRPLIAWSFDVLREAGCRPIVVPAPPRSADRERAALGPGADVVEVGGDRRSALLAALDALASPEVVLHDAARPFVTVEQVTAVVRGLGSADVVVAAVPVRETIKLVDGDRVEATVARDHLWQPQTPQAYRTDVLRAALEECSDDTSVIEAVRALDADIVLVSGSSKNIKVTSADDLRLAEAIARAG